MSHWFPFGLLRRSGRTSMLSCERLTYLKNKDVQIPVLQQIRSFMGFDFRFLPRGVNINLTSSSNTFHASYQPMLASPILFRKFSTFLMALGPSFISLIVNPPNFISIFPALLSYPFLLSPYRVSRRTLDPLPCPIHPDLCRPPEIYIISVLGPALRLSFILHPP